MSASQEKNPDSRPLPDGWVTEYSPEWNAWYYVNTKDANPAAVWQHPADLSGGAPSAAAPSSAGPSNPDTRPLPEGWVSEYSQEHNTWYYVDTKHPEKGATWEHPSATQGPTSSSVPPVSGSIPAPFQGKQHDPVTASIAPAPAHPDTSTGVGAAAYTGPPTSENPDKRPLPPGWISKYDDNYKTWYYVDTTKPGGPSSWEHPAEKNSAAPAPVQSPLATNPIASPGIPPAGAPTGAPSKGLEGLLGASAGKMVGGLLGTKARTQMDGFADILGGEINKFKKNPPPAGPPPGQGQYQAPTGQGQYQAPPGQASTQAVPPPSSSSGPPGGGLGSFIGKFTKK